MNELERRLEDVTVPLDVAVIGCVVNGPGEALKADLGSRGSNHQSSALPGGKSLERLDNERIADHLERVIRATHRR